jgi:hypothetical protein
MTGVVVEYDPYDPDTQRDPYPAYRALRRHSPVHYVRARDLWVITRWDHAAQAAQSPKLTATRGVSQIDPFPDDPETLPGYAHSIATADPPEHTRRRKLQKVFSARTLRDWQIRIERIAADLVDELVAKARGGAVVDVAGQLAHPLPPLVILDLLGLPRTELEQLNNWSARAINLLPGRRYVGMDAMVSGAAASEELARYIEALIDGTAAVELAPDGLLASLAGVRDDNGQGLGRRELVGNAIALILGGLETTGSLVSNGLAALTANPDQFDRLRADPGLLDGAVEEMLRYDSPAQGTFRTATEPVEIGGTLLPTGARIQLAWGAANRDEAVHDNSETFDIGRKQPRQVAFGTGRHFCVGAALARAEARAVFTALLMRTTTMTLAGEPEIKTNLMPVLRSHDHLPVHLS